MPKKIIVLTGFVFLFSFNLSKAAVVINEFISHPNTGETEWVELFNNSENSQDLSGWKLTELTSPSTTPTEVNWGPLLSGTISAQGVLVFEISGTKLNDSGDSIGLYDNLNNLVSRVTYGTSSTVKNYSINLTASVIGKSGALIADTWQANQDPTKGTQNPIPPTPPPVGSGSLLSNNSNNESSSLATNNETKDKIPEERKTEIKINVKTLGFVGLPLTLSALAYGHSGEQLRFGKYFWNFGDGDSKEISVIDSTEFSHTYFYPGEYFVNLDYYPSNYTNIPEASGQVTIKIIPEDIIISRVGDDKDFFIELKNNTDYPADISNYFLISDNKNFTIPRNTILFSKKTMMLSPRITNFSLADKNSLKLMTKEREIAFAYMPTISSSVPAKIITPPSSFVSSVDKSVSLFGQGQESGNLKISPTNLQASVLQNNVVDSKNLHAITVFIVFIIFVGISAGIVYLVRQKSAISDDGSNFEIIDE